MGQAQTQTQMQTQARYRTTVMAVAKRITEVNRTELAARMGVGKSHVSLVLRGKRVPSLPLAAQMARVLGVSLNDLHDYLENVWVN